jgi:hypothetical protein
MDSSWELIFFLVILAGGGLFFLVVAAAAVGIFLLGKNVVAPMRQRQLESIIDDWARERGYELVGVRELPSRDHPFADRFGAGFGKGPAVVKYFEVRKGRGKVRRGWAYVRARLAGRGGYSGFRPESLEVAWDE